MKATNPVESLAKAVYSAMGREDILPCITREYRNTKEKVRPNVEDCDIYHFPQLWGSTALGFGGMGGAAMTMAYTTVIICDQTAAVFFSGRFAYAIDNFPKSLMEDLNKHSMPSITNAEKYNISEPQPTK